MSTPLRVSALADLLDTTFEGDGQRWIVRAAPIETATEEELSFVGSAKAAEHIEGSRAGCLIVPLDLSNPSGRTLIRAAQPRGAFASALKHLYPPAFVLPAVHPSAVIAPTAAVHPGCSIGPNVTIGEGTEVGAGTRIESGCAIAAAVKIGRDCVLHANVTIYSDVEVGSRVILHSGCVLGADGFGFVRSGDRYEKFPQVGRVAIGDDVEIGANCCIDRAALGTTAIGEGSKLDNMVHVGHNCRIGKHVVIAAQTGLSGGVVIGDYAIVGGQVGIGDKARIESGAVLGSKCGILPSKIVRAGEPLWGIPARPLRSHLEQLANVGRLPQLREQVRELQRRLRELESQ